MQEVPIVAVIADVGIKAIAAVHGETPMITNAGAGTVGTVHCVATNDAGMNTSADVVASSDGTDVSTAKPADMTDAATDVSTTANAAQSSDVSTAAKSANMSTAAEAAAHVTAAATATARLCLHGKQAGRQQGGCQNGYHLSHHFLHSVVERCAPTKKAAQHQSF
jgi:hypothetical protein